MLFEPYVGFHSFCQVWVTKWYWEIAAHSAYDSVPNCQISFFPTSVFGVGISL